MRITRSLDELSTRKASSESTEKLRLVIGNRTVALQAPARLLSIIERMLKNVPRDFSVDAPAVQIDVGCSAQEWHISTEVRSACKTLSRQSSLPQVAGAVVSCALAAVADYDDVSVCRGSVVEKGGRALMIAGEEWEACVSILAHLHTRGWRILGADYAIVENETLIVIPFNKNLHVTSCGMDSFPMAYRRAIEASPWYSTSELISFYSVDPTLAGNGVPWGERTPMSAVVWVTGAFAERPALATLERVKLGNGLAQSVLAQAGIDVAALLLGDSIATADLLERWFEQLSHKRLPMATDADPILERLQP